MNDNSSSKVGQIAVELGFINQTQLNECMALQKQLQEIGIKELLGHVMLKKNYLTKEQLQAILRTAGLYKEIIPGYEIISKLGSGGMGVVYRAKHITTERPTALKLLSPTAAKDEDYIKRFIREAKIASSINHPNIVTTYDVGEYEGRYYIAMEYIDGVTVKSMLDNAAISEKEATRIVRDVALALDEISKTGIVHRDIKPENIMLTREGVVKLCDFGLAKITNTPGQSLTQSGLTLGTPYYMSPEQIKEEKNLDIRSDFYSLGASYFHMLVGKVPFDGETPSAILAKHLTEAPPSPKSLNKKVSPEASAVCLRMLDKQRQKRYQTSESLLADLNELLSDSPDKNISAMKDHMGETMEMSAQLEGGASNFKKVIYSGVLVLIIAALAYAFWPEGERNNNSVADSGDRTNVSDQNPQTLDEREKQAKSLFEEISMLFKQQDYFIVRDKLMALSKDYSNTKLYADKSSEIQQMKNYVENGFVETQNELDKLESMFNKVRNKRKEINKFKNHYDKFVGAYSKFINEEQNGRLSKLYDRYEQYEKYMGDLLVAQKSYENSEYSELLLRRLNELRFPDDKENDFYEYLDPPAQNNLITMSKQTEKEIEVGRLLREAQICKDTNNYAGLNQKVSTINQYKDTNTYNKHKNVIREYDELIKTIGKNSLERDAEIILSEADDFKTRGIYREALKRYTKLLDLYPTTTVVQTKKEEISAKIAELKRTFELQRETEAEGKYKEFKLAFEKEEWERARELLGEIGEYKDTKFISEKDRDLKRADADVEYNLKNVTLLDLPGNPKYKPNWQIWTSEKKPFDNYLNKIRIKEEKEMNSIIFTKKSNHTQKVPVGGNGVVVYTPITKSIDNESLLELKMTVSIYSDKFDKSFIKMPPHEKIKHKKEILSKFFLGIGLVLFDNWKPKLFIVRKDEMVPDSILDKEGGFLTVRVLLRPDDLPSQIKKDFVKEIVKGKKSELKHGVFFISRYLEELLDAMDSSCAIKIKQIVISKSVPEPRDRKF
ncbi:MAG: protein kinase [Planctomycetes bacterium]|nr:protein kinase [Planctomycetota bacterium]